MRYRTRPQKHPPVRGIKAPAAPDLETPTINMPTIQRPRIHARQAVHIDGDGRRAIGHFSVGETFDTAGAAEQVADHLVVKKIFGESVFAGLQLETLQRCKCQYKTHALAAGAVAGDSVIEIDVDFVGYGSALAATFIMCW